MPAKSNVVVSEGQVTFKRVEGHKHDGLTSSLIDTSKYSMFDFVATENSKDTAKAAKQRNNKNVLKTFIIDTVEGRVLNPEGIRIQANAISAREIIAGTITADELSSNIVLVNNVIRSNNYISNSTTFTGWAIYSNGEANFNNVNIRGNLKTGNGFYASANTPLYADNIGQFSLGNKFIWNTTANSLSINAGVLTLGSNLSWDGNTLSIRGSLLFSDGSTPGTFDNGDSLTGGSIGGILIGASSIRSSDYDANPTTAGFVIFADGTATFNEVSVRGAITATSGNISGTVTIGTTAASTVVSGAASGSSAVQPAGVQNNLGGAGVTTITGGKISTGIISSVGGTRTINLDTGAINFGNFTVSAAGDAVFAGSITASTITGSTVSTTDGTNGILITSDGYLRGTGGSGIRVQNSDGSTGGTQLFKDVIFSNTTRGDKLEVVSRFTAADIGVTISPTSGNTPLELERNYATTANFIRFRNTSNSTYPGAIEFNGTNGLTYKVTSDKRLKENIEEIINACSIVKKLSPVEFNFISDGPSLKMHGFLAQDMYEVYTYPVSVGSDDVEENPWGVDYGKITPLLTAALKEALERIESLEARIQTLEGV